MSDEMFAATRRKLEKILPTDWEIAGDCVVCNCGFRFGAEHVDLEAGEPPTCPSCEEARLGIEAHVLRDVYAAALPFVPAFQRGARLVEVMTAAGVMNSLACDGSYLGGLDLARRHMLGVLSYAHFETLAEITTKAAKEIET